MNYFGDELCSFGDKYEVSGTMNEFCEPILDGC